MGWSLSHANLLYCTILNKHELLFVLVIEGCTKTDFQPQLAKLSRDHFTLIGWDPRGYGKSIPPERDWPDHFLKRDAEDAVKLMEV